LGLENLELFLGSRH